MFLIDCASNRPIHLRATLLYRRRRRRSFVFKNPVLVLIPRLRQCMVKGFVAGLWRTIDAE